MRDDSVLAVVVLRGVILRIVALLALRCLQLFDDDDLFCYGAFAEGPEERVAQHDELEENEDGGDVPWNGKVGNSGEWERDNVRGSGKQDMRGEKKGGGGISMCKLNSNALAL